MSLPLAVQLRQLLSRPHTPHHPHHVLNEPPVIPNVVVDSPRSGSTVPNETAHLPALPLPWVPLRAGDPPHFNLPPRIHPSPGAHGPTPTPYHCPDGSVPNSPPSYVTAATTGTYPAYNVNGNVFNQNSISNVPPGKYYFEDGNVMFSVKNQRIYRVHRYLFLTKSTVLPAKMYSYHPTTPILLDDVEPKDFELLLSILYPETPGKLGIEGVEEWSAILRVAKLYEMKSIERLALDEILNIASPVERIVIAREQGVSDWLVGAFTELCLSKDPLTDQEKSLLGMQTTLMADSMKQGIMDKLEDYLDMQKVRSMITNVLKESGL
ncbi:hypothetical protein D9758_006722 [Tetrapyrgos nigripes]|nr:hypothetical protein D9758_006722 [Tetrapyrgos nigripes]